MGAMLARLASDANYGSAWATPRSIALNRGQLFRQVSEQGETLHFVCQRCRLPRRQSLLAEVSVRGLVA